MLLVIINKLFLSKLHLPNSSRLSFDRIVYIAWVICARTGLMTVLRGTLSPGKHCYELVFRFVKSSRGLIRARTWC